MGIGTASPQLRKSGGYIVGVWSNQFLGGKPPDRGRTAGGKLGKYRSKDALEKYDGLLLVIAYCECPVLIGNWRRMAQAAR